MELTFDEMDEVVDMFKSLLNDDNGVSEESYNKMYDFAMKMNYPELTELFHHVDATDGRFYLKV